MRNQKVPEKYRTLDKKTSLQKTSKGDCSRLQNRPEISRSSADGIPGGSRSIPGQSIQRYEFVCHTCKKSDNNAKRYPAS